MIETEKKLSMRARLLFIGIATLAVMLFVGTQFQVSSQGDSSTTYPKGFRGGTCTIESDALLVGYSAYFIPADYAIPENAISAVSVPVLCGKVPKPGTLGVTIDLLYPESARNRPLALSLVRMEENASKRTILSIPPRSYETGILTHVMQIDSTGEYRLYLSGKNENQVEFRLEIPITVGTPWYGGIATFWPMLLLTIAAIVFYNFRKIFD
ncbi:hypothetical protein [Nitrosospira sp. Is2]|uniref:hypothetical protein n=1 Tax=Nitrosospira sp. Is2 TaxID=3080532 RepID=UPI00295334E4|nr:hypothetical protein [Nitrosospira sp. Is2]WON73704.1 hypothetical protein R5L00_14675 [Nitrosospira sp. Is2]